MANSNRLERLTQTPEHLGALADEDEDNPVGLAEVKAAADAAGEPKPSDESEEEARIAAKKAAMRKARYQFNFNFTSSNGKSFTGKFISAIPTIRDREKIGIMRAQLAGGLPVSSLDKFTDDLNMMLSHLAYMLEENDASPPWAKDLRSLLEVDVLYALWEEVRQHEATFLGSRKAS